MFILREVQHSRKYFFQPHNSDYNRYPGQWMLIKTMNQLNHMTSVIVITVCKVIQKIITKIDFWYQADIKKRPRRSVWYQKSMFTYCNCNYRYHVVQLIHGLKSRILSRLYYFENGNENENITKNITGR